MKKYSKISKNKTAFHEPDFSGAIAREANFEIKIDTTHRKLWFGNGNREWILVEKKLPNKHMKTGDGYILCAYLENECWPEAKIRIVDFRKI